MIDNFDQLVERCNAKRRKYMIRISLWISGAVLIAVAITAMLMQWQSEPNLSKASEPISPMICTETTKSEDSNARQTLSLPAQDFSKNRAFVVQLTSSKSFDDVNATRYRLPERYRSSLAIYYINGFYTLRYIDIYDRESIPQIVAYFHAAGFPSATVYEYNPDRIAISSAVKPSSASAKTKPVSAPVQDVPVTITLPPLPAQSAVAKTIPANRLLSVHSSIKNTTQDFINLYNTNPKYETALAVARSFYTKENFVNAAFWAKKANQINREGEEAWLLYAKSTYAQGHTADAIAILELYLNYKDSKAATELIKTWR